MTNITNPKKKSKITKKELASGQIDKSKIVEPKRVVIRLNKPDGKSTAGLHHQKGKEKSTYTPADVRTGDKRYGKESATKPTPEFIKKAQAAKVDIVRKDNKPFRAGHTKTEKHPDKHTHVKIKPDLKMVVPIAPKASETGAGKDKIKQSGSPGPKRRLERVNWLKGRNKRTEAGHG